jgi:hypothetical protein
MHGDTESYNNDDLRSEEAQGLPVGLEPSVELTMIGES